MTKFYRYELYCDGEYQGVGIFQGLDELNLREEIEDAILAPFDKLLSVPHIGKRCEFLFTEKGNEMFHEGISRIWNVYASDSLYEVRLLKVHTSDIPPEEIVYMDSFQIAVSVGFLEKYRA